MTQPQTLTQQQLLDYANQLQNGTLQDVHQVYADLYSKGYNYAGWADGVASEDTIAGVSAVNFLTETALMGWGGPQCRNLPSATLDSIRIQMAKGYVDALVRKAEQAGGSVSEDVIRRQDGDRLVLHGHDACDHGLPESGAGGLGRNRCDDDQRGGCHRGLFDVWQRACQQHHGWSESRPVVWRCGRRRHCWWGRE